MRRSLSFLARLPLWKTLLFAVSLPAVANDAIVVRKELQRPVEITCRLDVFTLMLYEGLTSDVGGKTSFTFNKNCAELQGREISWKDGRSSIHPKTLLTWDKGLSGITLNANGQLLELPRQSKNSFRVVALGRMTLIVLDTQGWVYDNAEQHWCPFAMEFPASKGKEAPLFWYDKASGNVVRLYQYGWNTPIQKTQHYLPAVCSNSSPPKPPDKPVRYRIKDLPVRVWNGPVVITH